MNKELKYESEVYLYYSGYRDNDNVYADKSDETPDEEPILCHSVNNDECIDNVSSEMLKDSSLDRCHAIGQSSMGNIP
jgi:hypothetical protein